MDATDATRSRGEGGRWRRRGLIGLVVLLVVALLAQPVRTRVVAAVTVVDGLDLPVPRPFATEVERRATTVGDLEVDVYGPPDEVATSPLLDGPQAAGRIVVLVPGATPAGRDDRRLVTLAEAFARSDRVVVIPELEVYQEDLVPEDIERIVGLVGSLADRHGPVVLTGISFGGSLAMIAAGDPRLEDRIALLGTFGAYADLGGVVQAATTGESLVDGERYPWDPDPRAAQVVRDQIVGLLPPEDGRRLEAALDGEVAPAALRPDLRAAYDLLTNEDPERTMALVEALPQVVRDRLEVVSPTRAVPQLEVPLVALHAHDDPVIPYGELWRLGVTYPHAELMSLTTFDHVGIDPDREVSWWVTVQDLWTTSRFADRMLDAQARGWW